MYKSLYPIMQHLIEFQFNSIDSWLDSIDCCIRRDTNELKEKWDRETADMSEEERNEYAYWNNDEPWYTTEVFPRFFWQSAFVTIWSYFEKELVGVCRKDILQEAGASKESKLMAAKIRYLYDVKEYLIDKRSVDISQEWDEVTKIHNVRNQIVHDGGRRCTWENHDGESSSTKKRSKQVDSYVASREKSERAGLSFEDDTLVVGREFCVEVVLLAKDFVLDVLKRIPETSTEYRDWKKAATTIEK